MHDQKLTSYYQDELRILRRDAQQFSKRHPDLAESLGLDWGANPDPMVERMVESMAWFTARLRKNSDARLPMAAQQVLNLLAPNFSAPVPSVGMASLSIPENIDKEFPAGRVIPAGTRYYAAAGENLNVRWRTAWPVTISAAKITRQEFLTPPPFTVPASTLSCLRLKVSKPGQLAALSLFLKGDPYTTHPLHEFVFTNLVDVRIRISPDIPPVSMGACALRPGGMSRGQLLFPSGLYAHPAHQLVQEYFICPDRFLYWDVDLPVGNREGDMEIYILLHRKPPAGLDLRMLKFDTATVPVVNLYEAFSEPVQVDHTRNSYLLRAEDTHSVVHSIIKMEAISTGHKPKLAHYCSDFLSGADTGPDTAIRWYTRRVPADSGEGAETRLFVKPTRKENFLDPLVISARILCTDGANAEMTGNRQELSSEDEGIATATMERPPTQHFDPVLDGDALWRLVSCLGVQRRSLLGEDAAGAVRDVLSLYVPPGSSALNQINAIVDLQCIDACEPVRPAPGQPFGGLAHGHEISVWLNPDAFVRTSAFMFATVLGCFFDIYAGINSFIRLKAFAGDQQIPLPAKQLGSGARTR